MDALLNYILQVNLLLAIVFLGYQFLLKNLTFYSLNRVYFLIAALYALVYPLIDMKSWLIDDAVMSVPVIWDYVPMQVVEHISYSLYDVLIAGVIVGIVVFVAKLCMQLMSLLRIHFHSKQANWHSFLFRDVLFPIVPFSFFNKIYLHKAQHQEVELLDIFEHENIHVKGLHTWDVLLFEMLLIGCWYNPFVWLMRKAVRQNLEFLTDQQVLNKGVDRQTYQYSLLNVTQQGAAVGISNQFNFKTLKKRIMMMNKRRSSRLELSRYAFLLPIFLLAGASFTVSQAESKIVEVVDLTKEIPLDVMFPKNEFLNSTLLADKLPEELNNKLASTNDSAGFMLNGKLVDLSVIKKIDVKDFESAVINVDNALTKKYGKKSILHIVTKEYMGTTGTPSQFTAITFDGNKVNMSGGKVSLDKGDNKSVKISTSYAYIDSANNKPTLVGNGKLDVADAKSLRVSGNVKSVSSLTFGNKNLGHPLIILDGKEISNDGIKKIDPNNIESIAVLKDASSTSLYGDKGKDGVILITTKSTKGTITVKGYKKADSLEFTAAESHLQGKVSGVSIGEGKALNKVTLRATGTSKPLFVVDGIDKGIDFEMDKLDPNNIESITVLKDASATSLYGGKAKDGVIIVETKELAKAKTINDTVKKAILKEVQIERRR